MIYYDFELIHVSHTMQGAQNIHNLCSTRVSDDHFVLHIHTQRLIIACQLNNLVHYEHRLEFKTI